MSGHKKKSSLDTALRRGASRLAAVQALYQLDMGGGLLDDISRDFLTGVQGGEVIEEDEEDDRNRDDEWPMLNLEIGCSWGRLDWPEYPKKPKKRKPVNPTNDEMLAKIDKDVLFRILS